MVSSVPRPKALTWRHPWRKSSEELGPKFPTPPWFTPGLKDKGELTAKGHLHMSKLGGVFGLPDSAEDERRGRRRNAQNGNPSFPRPDIGAKSSATKSVISPGGPICARGWVFLRVRVYTRSLGRT